MHHQSAADVDPMVHVAEPWVTRCAPGARILSRNPVISLTAAAVWVLRPSQTGPIDSRNNIACDP